MNHYFTFVCQTLKMHIKTTTTGVSIHCLEKKNRIRAAPTLGRTPWVGPQGSVNRDDGLRITTLSMSIWIED